MAGFEYRGQLNGAENPATVDVVIKNSTAIAVGDCVSSDTAGLIAATNAVPILGVVVSLTNSDGIDFDNANTGTYTGTWVSSTQTYTAASDNVTVDECVAKCIVDPMALFYNDGDGVMALVDVGCHMKLDDKDQVTVGSPSATVGQVQVIKIDPNGTGDLSEGIFKISFSQSFAYEVET